MRGAGAVARRLSGLRLGAVEEVCVMLTARVGVLTERAGGPVPGGPGAVVHRTVVEGTPPIPGLCRVVDRIPAELVIVDRRVALLPLASGAAGTAALVVHSGALLDSLIDLFEDAWHEGRPLRPGGGSVGGPSEPDATDLEVLSLLLAGLTDASVAKQLGLGLRTVQRRVRRLMELAGVTTRLQLGWQAAERGWGRGRGGVDGPLRG
ncbi:LuxR family transcriptional regulator [Streptomyces luteoverticillatus]|uniref:LuxR family transcriptional regulator n=1 Tax=Streptomyces luteoverticillatus TaxID=66425 RepID=A0A3S9PP52_STRLT|nr:helix-turn-helix transcriptional regulator [Streptomyces luteoverticillatus]AZQ74088.1 LuxR family transcriptional regulator [Streptomyces luteoverticillatus]